MPLWLDLLRTPMAAPESGALRRMRFTWQALCLSTAACVGLFAPLHRMVGRLAAIVAAILLMATALCTWVYAVRKHRIDTAYIERVGEKD